jgi:hypothetical protein
MNDRMWQVCNEFVIYRVFVEWRNTASPTVMETLYFKQFIYSQTPQWYLHLVCAPMNSKAIPAAA